MTSASVVVPVRDGAGLLPPLLGAMAAQTVPPEAVIVVDDGSSDRTAALAREWGATVITGEGKGPYSARQLGWKQATTTHVVFADARSRPHPVWLERLVAAAADRQVALVASDVRVSGERTLAQRIATHQQFFTMSRSRDGGVFLPFAPTCNLLVRRTALEAVDGFRPVRGGGDADLCYRIQLSGQGRFVGLDEVLMDWEPREGLRELAEQIKRYGESGAGHAATYATQGATGPPPLTVPRIALRGARRAAELASAYARRDRAGILAAQSAAISLYYDIGYRKGWRGTHPQTGEPPPLGDGLAA